MSLNSIFRLLTRRTASDRKPDADAEPASDSIWDRRLTGDNWIGVFLILVSLVGFYEVSQYLV
jgi:hypothetical protein